jgi:hypothetical protein
MRRPLYGALIDRSSDFRWTRLMSDSLGVVTPFSVAFEKPLTL